MVELGKLVVLLTTLVVTLVVGILVGNSIVLTFFTMFLRDSVFKELEACVTAI